MLGVAEMEPMSAGTTIKIYKMEQTNTPDQVGEGETIALTKINRKLARTVELVLKSTERIPPLKQFRKSAGILLLIRLMKS